MGEPPFIIIWEYLRAQALRDTARIPPPPCALPTAAAPGSGSAAYGSPLSLWARTPAPPMHGRSTGTISSAFSGWISLPRPPESSFRRRYGNCPADFPAGTRFTEKAQKEAPRFGNPEFVDKVRFRDVDADARQRAFKSVCCANASKPGACTSVWIL